MKTILNKKTRITLVTHQIILVQRLANHAIAKHAPLQDHTLPRAHQMQQRRSHLHPPNRVQLMLQGDGALKRRPLVPLVQRVQAKALIVLDNVVDNRSLRLAIGQAPQVLVEIGLARIHKINLFGELLRERRLAGAKVALDSDEQRILAQLEHGRVG